MTKNTKEQRQETVAKMQELPAAVGDKNNDAADQDISDSVAIAFGSFIDDINKKKNKSK